MSFLGVMANLGATFYMDLLVTVKQEARIRKGDEILWEFPPGPLATHAVRLETELSHELPAHASASMQGDKKKKYQVPPVFVPRTPSILLPDGQVYLPWRIADINGMLGGNACTVVQTGSAASRTTNVQTGGQGSSSSSASASASAASGVRRGQTDWIPQWTSGEAFKKFAAKVVLKAQTYLSPSIYPDETERNRQWDLTVLHAVEKSDPYNAAGEDKVMTLIRRKISGPQLLLELFRQYCPHAVTERDNAAAIFLYMKRKILNGEQLWVVVERFVSNENKAILEGYTPDEQTKRVVLKRCLSEEEWKKFSAEASKDTNKSIQDLTFADMKPFIDRQCEAEKSAENLRQQASAHPAGDKKEKFKKAEQGKGGGKGKGKGRGKKQ
uniref:Uncharacterized protein n=1 Tax=Chromera velia CCMP2878 TaxID=1169474 RepID=A0A0G4FEH3_9ALVE|eukprot:Cvel_16608.t1-p1 / transcript=Cvel_16608.t1 / gene=Cvel_16608 / organism=Chromera_velia_CCMP2878 / gene_product=hypothetical protein / transcript_product=hypothetical protein / location=Cvel_scaffold1287:275-3470(+) / protein_length=383 / sequence_SO=supercontig / SO=protein_coding / is_pseudo=false